MNLQLTNPKRHWNIQWAVLLFYVFHLTGALAQNATATINFDQLSGRTINKGAFGLNLFQGFDPAQAGNPGNTAYKDAMAFMKPGIVRYHSWEMMGLSTNRNGWLTSSNTWDAAKINNAFTGANAYGPILLMNIPGWPSAWADAGGKLLPARYTDFANLCASLVRILNVDQRRGIKYWEVTNERDDLYGLQSDELGRIYNQAVAAMKAVDNTILTGGPAFARPDLTAQVDAFFSTAAPNIDFVTYHSYATGTNSAPTQQVYDLAASNARITTSIRTAFAKYSTRTVEYFHDEYNISWNPPDPHQSSYVSMLFDAIFTITAIKSGATGTMAWNECDGWYGKMDNSYNKRPSAYLFSNFNHALPGGSVCNSTVSNDASLVVLASQKGSLRQLVVVNRSDVDQRYKFTFTGLPAGVNNATLFANSQNVPAGGIVTKDVSYGQLAAGTGALFEKNTVSILTIDVNNLRSTGDATAPGAPAALRSTTTDNSVTLIWNAATDNTGVTGYDVYLNGAYLASTGGTTTTYTAAWLNPSTSYSFTVRAKDATGNESAASPAHSVSTTALVSRPVASVFTASSWNNSFSGNVVNDAGQTTTSAGTSALRQNEELRVTLSNMSQYEVVYQSTFTNVINLSGGSDFRIDIQGNIGTALRVKLFDDANNSIDFWQNTLYTAGDNQSQTYTLNFAGTGFGSVNAARVKGIVLMNTNAGPINGTLYFDNLRLGTIADGQAPAAPTNLTAVGQATGINLSWTAATDNVGVTGYDVFNGGAKVNASAITTTSYAVTGLATGSTYVFTVKARDAAGNVSAASNAVMATTVSSGTGTYTKVTGTPFGTSPYGGCTTCTFDKAFDGNTGTYFDASTANGGYAGLDAGTAKVVKRIRYYPRATFAGRMTGGKFQGSNTSSGTGYVDLYTVPSQPAEAWQQVDLTNGTGYRYLRYLGPDGGYGNVAEVEFYTDSPSSGFSGTYKITARHSGKALDVSNSSTADGGNVQQWTDNGSTAQQWIITPTTDGYYKIVCKASGKALDVANGSTADGGNVQQWTYFGNLHQQWLIEPTTDGYYKITARHSGKALDVNGGTGATADGANVHQWGYGGWYNQQWKIDLLSTATSRLTAEGVRPAAVRLYPNPVTGGVLHVQVPTEGNQAVRVQISNGLGQRVLTLERTAEAGQDLRISVSGLRKGVYVATVVIESGRSVAKFVVR
ncbi:MAG: RICIN domain-containing protein [Cytophagales bacterium]|nr:RICIN domain-containing protein [Cytophagales bacterium]